MRKFKCHNFNQEHPKIITLTEEDILATLNYWDYWTTRMHKLNRTSLINKENCILDWCATNWAWEVTNNSE